MTVEREKNDTCILVVKLSSLGDHFHALPAVHHLKEQWGARIDWVTQPMYHDLVSCFTDVDRVISFPRKQFFRNAPTFLRSLRATRYDTIIDFQGLLKSAMVSSWARGGRRIGPSHSREGARLFYSSVFGDPHRDSHAVDQALDVVRYLGLNDKESVFPVTFPKVVYEPARPRVALVPVSRWPTKNWPVAHFVQTARAIQEKTQASIFLVGAPGDEAVCRAIEEQLEGHVYNLCGKTSLVQLGGTLQEMDLVITVDSGPMHMAAAVGTPVLALFGPTDPGRTGPYGNMHRVLTAERTPCWPCRKRDCPVCIKAMENLSPDVVIAAALDVLSSGV